MSDSTNTTVARPVSPLDELVREGARQLLQRALELEVAEVLTQFDDVRDDAGRHRIVRNGHLPERTLLTGAGPLDLRQPRVRDRAGKDAPDQVRFTSAILPPYLSRVARGGRMTDPADYPAEKTTYALRSTDSVVRRATTLGPNVEVFAQKLFEGPLPWSKLRQGQKLISLGEKYSGERLDAACKRALDYDLIDVRQLHRILVQAFDRRRACRRDARRIPGKSLRPPTRCLRSSSARGRRMTVEADLVILLKRLKLGPILATLPDRLALARAQKLDYAAFLTLILAVEVQRRDNLALERRLIQAGFEERVTLEHFDWSTAIQLDRRHLNELFSLQFLQRKEHALLIGPVGVGKTFLAQALGAAATRAGHSVLFRRSDYLLRELSQSRADHTFEAVFRRYLAPDLLIVDDFGLHRLSQQQSEDLYALIIERHRRSSFIVTSNRDVSEWVG